MTDAAIGRLAERLADNPMDIPRAADGSVSTAFLEYLALVFTPQEADLAARLDLLPRFMSTADAAAAAGLDEARATEILERLLQKGAILGGGGMYCLPTMPNLLNLHQHDENLGPDDLAAAALYQKFFIQDKFYRHYESSDKGTAVMRAIPVNQAIEPGQRRLDAEEAHSFLLKVADEPIALVACPCRTRTEKMGVRECADRNPVGSCIMLGMSAVHFQNLGLGRAVTREQAVAYLDEMQDLGLVASVDNALSRCSVMCLCCECCCSQVRGRTRWDNPLAVSPSNFVPRAGDDCMGCGTCVDRCFFAALALDEDTDRPVVDHQKCIGCGVCAVGCPENALKLVRVERSTPFETAGRLMKTIGRENRGG